MTLTFQSCDLNEIAIGQLRGLSQNRTRNGELVMAGKSSNDTVRGIADRCEPCAEFGQRFRFDLLNKVGKDVVKNADLLVIEAFRVAEKESGDPSQNLGASIARTCGENILKFGNDGGSLRHFLPWAEFFLPPSTDLPGRP
jgi:hypothetical protein